MSARLRLLLPLFAALLLAGCGVRFAYTQLDWLLPWYLRDYVTLDAGQRSLLDERLAARLDWHCRNHLGGYAGLLRAAQDTLRAGRLDGADLEPFLQQGEAWWRALADELVADARVLLPGLSDEQVAEIEAAFARREREAREEFLDGSAAERRTAQIERMEKRLRRWFGRLHAEQRARVAAWSDALAPTTEQWLEDRARWHQRLIDVLRVRDQPALFDVRVAALAAPAGADWPPGHRERVLRNRALTLQLLADVFNLATPPQRARLLDEVGSLAGQFEELACAAPPALARRTP